MQVTEVWHVLSREVECLSLEVLKTHHVWSWAAAFVCPYLNRIIGPDGFFSPAEVPSNFSHSVKDSLEMYWVPGLSLLF